MKNLYKFLCLIGLFVFISGCQKEEITRGMAEGEYAANFDFPTGDIYAPAKVVLVNRSRNATEFNWKFEGAKTITATGVTEVNTSTAMVPDTVLYEVPGTYSVKLVTKQDGKADSVIKEIVVKKPQPAIVVPENILYLQEFEFDASVFKYPDADITYAWDFGPNATSADLTVAKPKVTFNQPGVHPVTLTINDGHETLTATANVTVLDEIVKTLYFTDMKTGMLYKKRLTQRKETAPVGMTVNLGTHPLGMSVYNDRVFISNTGNNVTFAASANADGRIFSVDLDGKNEKIVTTATGNYQQDPVVHTIDENGNLWWTSRNGSLRTISANAVEAAYPATKIALTAAQAGVSSVFGWIDGGVQVVGNTVWYSKGSSAGRGLYKYTTTGSFIESVTALKDVKIKNFVIDTKNSKIYFVVNFTGGGYTKGLYVCNLDGTNISLVDALTGFSTEGDPNEHISVTGMAIDSSPDDGSAGYLYYGFRDATDISGTGAVIGSGANSGVKRVALDGSKPVEFFVKGFIPYGIAIDHVKR